MLPGLIHVPGRTLRAPMLAAAGTWMHERLHAAGIDWRALAAPGLTVRSNVNQTLPAALLAVTTMP